MREVVFIDIDTQLDFIMPQGKLYVQGAKTLLPNLKRLTRMALQSESLIISSLDTHIKNDPEFRHFPRHCLAGSPGQKKISATLLKEHNVIPQKILSKEQLFKKIKGHPQVVLEKNTYDVFANHNLPRLLKPFKTAFVYGLALDYCVKYAVLGLLQSGLKVNLIIDAAKPVDPKAGKALLNRFKNNGVRLIKTKDVLSEIKKYEY